MAPKEALRELVGTGEGSANDQYERLLVCATLTASISTLRWSVKGGRWHIGATLRTYDFLAQ